MKDIKIKIEKLHIYPQQNIDKVIVDIKKCDTKIQQAIYDWLETKAESNIIVKGISYNSLKEICKMNPIAAYLTLDWIIREQDIAIRILTKEYIGLL